MNYLRIIIKQCQKIPSEADKQTNRQTRRDHIFSQAGKQGFFTPLILTGPVILPHKCRTGLSESIENEENHDFYIKSGTGTGHHRCSQRIDS